MSVLISYSSAFKDPKIEGVTIYLADFERPINEKLQKNFFEDPTSTSLSCARDTTIKVGDINKDPQGEVNHNFSFSPEFTFITICKVAIRITFSNFNEIQEVFEVNRSLFFKVSRSINVAIHLKSCVCLSAQLFETALR